MEVLRPKPEAKHFVRGMRTCACGTCVRGGAGRWLYVNMLLMSSNYKCRLNIV